MANRVAVTGMAVASCLGNDLASLGEGVRSGRCGLTRDHRFSGIFPGIPLGSVDAAGFAAIESELSLIDSALMRMVAGTLRPLAQESKLFSRYRPADIGVFVGTTTGGLERLEQRLSTAFSAPAADFSLTALLDEGTHNGVLSLGLARIFPLAGPIFVMSTACSSGALALKEARDAVAHGLVPAALVGGFDILAPMTIAGFDALQILGHDFCRPLMGESRGINLAEGGAWLLLEAAPRPGTIVAYLAGASAGTDAHHMTQPDPSGCGMEAAMRGAISEAGVSAADIGYVNAHGTGTAKNDAAETRAMAQIFSGTKADCVSTKGLHGHTLAGAGALEAVVTVLEMKARGANYGLSNSFGFGGSNLSLVFASRDTRE